MKNTFFSKFKEENNHIYLKIKSLLIDLNLKFGNTIFFDDVDLLFKDFLDHYSLLERQLLLKNLISENCPQNEYYLEIFSKFRGERKYISFPNKTTLEVLDLIKNSDGFFQFYDKMRGDKI